MKSLLQRLDFLVALLLEFREFLLFAQFTDGGHALPVLGLGPALGQLLLEAYLWKPNMSRCHCKVVAAIDCR